MVYDLFKFIHVAAVIVWVGGVVAIFVMNARVTRSGEPQAQAVLAGQSRAFGQKVMGPVAGVTLVAGIITMLVGDISVATVWILWGLASVAASLLLGATVIRRTTERLAAGSGDRHPLQLRLARLNLANLVILFSAAAAMVFKP
jgi:uncharacterized membrane protein